MTGKDVEENIRSLIWRVIPAFAWRNTRNARKTLDSKCPAESQTKNFWNQVRRIPISGRLLVKFLIPRTVSVLWQLCKREFVSTINELKDQRGTEWSKNFIAVHHFSVIKIQDSFIIIFPVRIQRLF